MANKKINFEKEKPVTKYIDLFYMTPAEIKAKDIAELLNDEKDIKLELWDEMNILELELRNQNSVDFEPVDIHFKNASDAAFIKNRNINTIFAVNVNETDLDQVKSLFEKVIGQYSGFLCSDTEDFNPVYVGSLSK
ncbi:MAG TPA: hypothetical protein VN131_04495 [Mobilitalea sp.]|nr:hypothetical protein [Mobilitalea sp.]